MSNSWSCRLYPRGRFAGSLHEIPPPYQPGQCTSSQNLLLLSTNMLWWLILGVLELTVTLLELTILAFIDFIMHAQLYNNTRPRCMGLTGAHEPCSDLGLP
jgi:hypothetical protein